MRQIEDVLDYIASLGLGAKGSSLFITSIPETVSVGAMLRAPMTGVSVDPYAPLWRKTRIQVIVRDQDDTAGFARAYQFFDQLSVDNVQMGGVLVRRMHPRHEPVEMPRSEGANIEYSINYDIIYAITDGSVI